MCKHCCHNKNKEKNFYTQLIIPILLLSLGVLTPADELKTALFILAYLSAGFDILLKSLKNILKGEIFDENFLMSIATVGAMCIQEYSEAVAVMILYKIGEHLQDKALNKSQKSIENLINITPDYANLQTASGILKVLPETINPNDIIVVKAGEKIPLDGIIQVGNSSLDTSSLTGESVTKDVKEGDTVLSGCINVLGLLKIKVTKPYSESTAVKITELIKNAQLKKSKTEDFITKFAKYYTPCVVITALLIICLPLFFPNIQNTTNTALTFLVISCPCALVISIPLTFFCAIGTASRYGILIKGSSYIEKLANAKTIAFDKTGTLTKGSFSVTEIKSYNGTPKEKILEDVAYAEYYSNHPIAIAIKNKYGKEYETSKIKNIKEIAGNGIVAEIDDSKIIAGNKKLMHENGFDINEQENGTTIYIIKDNELTGAVTISDEIKPEAKGLIEKLHKLNIKTVMLTGDTKIGAEKAAKECSVDEYYYGLLPDEKVQKTEELINNSKKNESVIFAGDGINDAPVLTRSDTGIAMGALGSDAAIEAADVVISDDKISKIYDLIILSKKTIKTAKENIIFAISIKALFLALSPFGYITMWGAIFADVGVTLIAILNSMRIRKIK